MTYHKEMDKTKIKLNHDAMTNKEPKTDEVEAKMKELYSTEGIPEEMKQAISFMRQWLNEDRNATPMVTARDLWHWIGPVLETQAEQAERERLVFMGDILNEIKDCHCDNCRQLEFRLTEIIAKQRGINLEGNNN